MDYYLLFLINEVELGTHHACFTLNIKIKYVILDFESTSKFRKAVEDLKVGDGEKAGTTIGPIINSRCRWSHTIHIFSIQGTDDHIPYIFLVIILIGLIINSRYYWWLVRLSIQGTELIISFLFLVIHLMDFIMMVKTTRQLERVERIVKESVAAGAKVEVETILTILIILTILMMTFVIKIIVIINHHVERCW